METVAISPHLPSYHGLIVCNIPALADPNHVEEINGLTPLGVACAYTPAEVVVALLDAGADINFQTYPRMGHRPLLTCPEENDQTCPDLSTCGDPFTCPLVPDFVTCPITAPNPYQAQCQYTIMLQDFAAFVTEKLPPS